MVFRSGEGVSLFSYLFFSWKRGEGLMVSLTLLEGRQVRERGRLPGFGSGAGGSRWLRIPEFPPQLRRPGNVRPVSGAGAGPGGRKERPASSHSSRPVASLRQGAEPLPMFLLEHAGGDGLGEAGTENPSTIPRAAGRGQGLQPSTLNKGRLIPQLSFPPVTWRLRKIHSLLCPSPASQGQPGNQTGLWVGDPQILPEERTHHCQSPGLEVWGRDLQFGDVF